MFLFGQAVQWIGIGLLVVILILVYRGHLQRMFPLFTTYVAYMTLTTMLRSLFLSEPRIYFYVYWYAEPGAFLLKILAVHESFMHVFKSFYLMRWFRIVFPGTILLALLVSGWRAYTHPAQASAAGSAIIAGAMAAQYIVLAISIVFIVLVAVLRVPWRIHEYRIILGFGISALAIFAEGALRSEFVTRFTFLSRMLAAMAYILALAVWVAAVRYPLSTSAPTADERLSLETLIHELRKDVGMIRTLLRKI